MEQDRPGRGPPPQALTRHGAGADAEAVLDHFRAALIARNIVPPDPIVADGRLRRCNAAGARGRGDAAYLLHLDSTPAGGFENWRDGLGWETWRHDSGLVATPAERQRLSRLSIVAKAARDDAARQHHEKARHDAERIWAASRPAPPDHPYLARKGVDAHDLRVYKGVLVVPVRDLAGVLHSLQFISPGGVKRFLQAGRVHGLCCCIGPLPESTASTPFTVCIAEGFATGASLSEASGHAVAIAFHAGNLSPIASAIRKRYPGAHIVVCADDDANTPGNPGRTLAQEAARQVGGWLAVPDFGDARPPDATDFNDLHRLRGLSAVLTSLNGAAAPASPSSIDAAP